MPIIPQGRTIAAQIAKGGGGGGSGRSDVSKRQEGFPLGLDYTIGKDQGKIKPFGIRVTEIFKEV